MRTFLLFIIINLWSAVSWAGSLWSDSLVCKTPHVDSFPLVTTVRTAPLCFDNGDYKGVVRAIHDLQKDIEKVTNCKPVLYTYRSDGNIRET